MKYETEDIELARKQIRIYNPKRGHRGANPYVHKMIFLKVLSA